MRGTWRTRRFAVRGKLGMSGGRCSGQGCLRRPRCRLLFPRIVQAEHQTEPPRLSFGCVQTRRYGASRGKLMRVAPPQTGFCNPQSLTCSTKVLDSAQELKAQPAVQLPPPRQQQRFSPDSDNEGPAHRRRVALPAGATCPQGFSVCPVSRRRGDQEKHYLACFDTTSSATQCGGCSNSDGGLRGQAPEGIDCTALPGVANGGSAACIESKCRICALRSHPQIRRRQANTPGFRCSLVRARIRL